jgi:F-type H+-transporting ATPase subunit epsilon
MPLHFELVTPERLVFKVEADKITLPTKEGEITILPHHIPLVAVLVAGIARITNKGVEEEVAVSGGFIEVLANDSVRVLADTAERGEELNLDSIRVAKERAEEAMKKAIDKDDAAYTAAAAMMERELARERLARRARAPRLSPTIKTDGGDGETI